MARLFGTDGVRGRANVDITAELAVELSVGAAHVLGTLGAFGGTRPRAIVARDTRATPRGAAALDAVAALGEFLLDGLDAYPAYYVQMGPANAAGVGLEVLSRMTTQTFVNRARAAGLRVIAVGTTTVRTLESAWDGRQVQPGSGDTRIFITPGTPVNVPDLLITNLHLPGSTLLLLVAAFAGESRIRAAYDEALARGYRFYSLGDAMLLERAAQP